MISDRAVIVPMFPLNLVSTSLSTASNPSCGFFGNPYPKSTLAVSTALPSPPDVVIVPTTFWLKNPAPATLTCALIISPSSLVVMFPVAFVVGSPPPAPPLENVTSSPFA